MPGFDGYLEEVPAGDYVRLQQDLATANVMADYYKEAYSDSARALLAAEDIGWQKLGVSNSDLTQISLTEAKEVSTKLHGYCESNPLLSRGREVRNSYLFSSTYQIGVAEAKTELTPQQKNIINKEKNQEQVFSMAALERIEAERYAAGNVFVLYDRGNKTFQQISFQQIGDIIYNPDDASEIWYVSREWTANVITADGEQVPKTFKFYYPADTYNPDRNGYASVIKNIPVDRGYRMIVDRVNLQAGGNLGIPDSFAATPWALAYSAYLSDGSKVLAALAEWAWLVKPKKRPAAEQAAATVRTERGTAGTLFTDADVSAMPKANAVDLNTGRPLAAQVASALGISIVLLLADPGQSGAFGTAQTLSDPNRRTMEARREKNTAFLLRCLKLIGIKEPSIAWPKMAPGTDKEETELTSMIWGTGLFLPEEIRPRLAELGHIELKDDKAPEGVMIPNNLAAKEAEHEMAMESLEKSAELAPSPADGSNSMANGKGRDASGVGPKSKTVSKGGERSRDK